MGVAGLVIALGVLIVLAMVAAGQLGAQFARDAVKWPLWPHRLTVGGSSRFLIVLGTLHPYDYLTVEGIGRSGMPTSVLCTFGEHSDFRTCAQ